MGLRGLSVVRRCALWTTFAMLVVLACAPLSRVRAQATESSATASDDVARGLFQGGKAAFAAGNYEEALQFFAQSFARSQRPQLEYNIGLAADRLRKDDEALAAFTAYLDQVPQAENRAEVEARIRALEKAKAARGPVPVALAPEQTARGASVEHARDNVAVVGPAQRDGASEERSITQRWWFWTGIGAIVAGGVLVALAASSGGDKQARPLESRTGVTVMALSAK